MIESGIRPDQLCNGLSAARNHDFLTMLYLIEERAQRIFRLESPDFAHAALH
jgi:hypothetical protein